MHEAYRLLGAERLAVTRRVLQGLLPEQHPSLLDVGCGGGGDLSYLRSVGWPADRLAGVDLIPNRLAAARLACPDVDLRLGDGSSLPFPDESVDVATAVTVFSSILDQGMRRALFAEMERVLRPGGVLLVYDFVVRKPTNPNVIGMPLRRLAELGRPPDWSIRLSPVLQGVAVGVALHPRLADLAMRLAPRTHRLSYWRKPRLRPAVVG
jgi:SAM-dependent methyltransferase